MVGFEALWWLYTRFMISNDNTEPPPAATLYNADGLLLPPLADTQDNSISSCVVQQAAFSAPFQAVPAQSATYMIGGNYTCPTTYGAGPRAEPDDFFNTLLSSVFHRGFNHICTDEQIYEDLLSRVILGEGWDTLLNRTGSVTCPLLTVLRHLDEAALQECHPIDRLALLHAVHTKYLVWSAP
ncbi:hypothetical protein FQN54_000310 [Arachnomyces sp. PD_36]|nr:hypothetical protein FQN54_000310 [Arachnomyces sp. PD_36]